jgi:Tol biopolymer transport system component
LLSVPGALTIKDVSHNGRILIDHLRRRASLMVLEPGAAAERDLSWLDGSQLADISPDGKSVLFTEGAEGGGEKNAAYLWDLSQPEPVRLGEGRAVALSPDSRFAIVLDSSVPNQLTIVPTGAGLPRQLVLKFTPRWATWLPDGKHALVSGVEGDARQRVFEVDLGTGAARALTPTDTWLCATSPDGSEFAVKEGTTGRGLIYSLRGGSPRVIPGVAASTSRDFPLQWSADGRSLYVQATTDTEREAVIDLVDVQTGARKPWKHLTASDPASFFSFEPDIRINRDGTAYAYSCSRFLTDLYVVDNVR